MGIFLLLALTSLGRAEPASWQQQLAARQSQERAQAGQELDLRMRRLKQSQDDDDVLFQDKLRRERDDLELSFKQETLAFEEVSRGDGVEDKKQRRRELSERQKTRRLQLEQDQRSRRKKFYEDQRAALAAEREFARQRRRQLEDDQRRQLDETRRVMSKS